MSMSRTAHPLIGTFDGVMRSAMLFMILLPIVARADAPAAGRGGDWNMLGGSKPAAALASQSPAAPPKTAASMVPTPRGNAPTVAPAAAVVAAKPGEFDTASIRRPVGESRDGGSSATPTPSSGTDLFRIASALALVIGLIFALRWGSRKLFNTPAATRSSRAIQVLGRSVLSPRQQLMLVRVGRRVLVVGDSGSQMSRLAEITDPEEIALLLGQLGSAPTPAVSPFGSLMSRLRTHFDSGGDAASEASQGFVMNIPREEVDASDEADDAGAIPSELGLGSEQTTETIAAARQQLSRLRERMQRMSGQFGDARGDPEPESGGGAVLPDANGAA